MEFKDVQKAASEMRELYRKLEVKKYDKEWDEKDIALGFVGDVGDLMKLVIAKDGKRDIKDIDNKLSHELSDCLWSILVLADYYKVDLESEFIKTMDQLRRKIGETK
ncbi:nucleotide pyrophosphohydrolase [bacterium]|jgi:NTP pyrophosphatase (non-canonical NTP hydrolase)|nr:nucleotide pyrophosphohydrolase [bacterium]